jgi:archaetidylinositol phosphate synthase
MSHDTWMHALVRQGVKPLARTDVTPNQLTTLRILFGVAAASCVAVGEVHWNYFGAGLFVVSILLDRADGELARLTGKSTPWGHAYDLYSDLICDSVIFVGLGLGLRDGTFGYWAVAMGGLAGVSVALIFWLTFRVEAIGGQRAAELQGIAGFDPDDAILLVPLAILLGWGEGLLTAATLGAPAFALFFVWRLGPRLRGAAVDPNVPK